MIENKLVYRVDIFYNKGIIKYYSFSIFDCEMF